MMITLREIDGEAIAVVLPNVPDDAPAEIREGIVRRNLVATTGVCPCGAEFVMPNRAARRTAARDGVVLRARIEHEDDCPAIDDTLLAAVERWRR